MRPIDADQLLDFIKFDERVIAPEEHTAQDIVMMIQTAPTITPPPNAPLTLEELREMDGEPVWISPVKENGKVPARWMLVSGYNPNKDVYLFAPSCNITQGYDGKSYGKTWLAYRRKPEEGAE